MARLPTLLLTLASCGLINVRSALGAAVATLYVVVEPTPTYTDQGDYRIPTTVYTDVVTPIRTATHPDGPVTTYIWENIVAEVLVHEPSSTWTQISEPYTRTFTLQQAATAYAIDGGLAMASDHNLLGFEEHYKCSMDKDAQTGACVGERIIPLVDHDAVGAPTTGTVTVPTTITGTLLPVATILDNGTRRVDLYLPQLISLGLGALVLLFC